jgi:hypothetical protein
MSKAFRLTLEDVPGESLSGLDLAEYRMMTAYWYVHFALAKDHRISSRWYVHYCQPKVLTLNLKFP